MIRTPKFWTKTDPFSNFISALLLPCSYLYYLGFLFNQKFTKPHKPKISTICIGNLTAGGSGKTPTAIAIGKLLKLNKIDFAYLSRGYRGSSFEMEEVSIKSDPKKTGDEPKLLCEISKTFISKNRLEALEKISKQHKLAIIDDGMQNPKINYDKIILVIDGKIGFGNQRMLPSGPLRQKIDQGIKKADLIIMIGENNKLLQQVRSHSSKKVIQANLKPLNLEKFVNQKLSAFCGLAYPEKFFSYLHSLDLNIIKTIPFPDHHPYSDEQLEELVGQASQSNSQLITTKKDWIRIPKHYQDKISYLDVDLEFTDNAAILQELQQLL